MDNDFIVLLLMAGAFLLIGLSFAWWLVRTIHREEVQHQKVLRSPQTWQQTLHVEDPMWKTDQHGRYVELDDGHLFYWSRGFDSDDVSS